MTGLFTDRFTAEMHIRVPADYTAVGSGTDHRRSPRPTAAPSSASSGPSPASPAPSSPASFSRAISGGLNNIHVYVTEKRKAGAADFAALAGREFEYLTSIFGQPESGRINIVELPEDAVSAAWAPEMACIAGNRIVDTPRPRTACSPTPSPTSGGARRSRPPRSTTPGSPTACRATAS